MRKWIEIGLGLLIVIPLTQLVTVALTEDGSIIADATNTTVGTEGPFVLVLFKFWPIIFGLALVAIAIYSIYRAFHKGPGGGE